MKIKTSKLIGNALNWVCAIADGKKPVLYRNDDRSLFPQPVFEKGTMWQLDYMAWSRAGPIIEREGITVSKEDSTWSAYFRDCLFNEDGSDHWQIGDTPLIAAMRCFVASKLGDEVDVPDALFVFGGAV